MNDYFKYRLLLLCFTLSLNALPLNSIADVNLLEEVMVFGKQAKTIGDRISANEGQITAADIDQLPIERSGDILELIPGVVATQHSGSGKANQYFLRGFNLDHGTDFSTRVDFMPVNMVSHGHGQGYTDLNFIIPELIGAINYRKGPFYGDAGDFSSTGEALIETARFLPGNLLSLQAGSFGYRRGLVANQWEHGLGQWLVGAELQGYDGPWDKVDEDVSKKNLVLKYAQGGELDGFDVAFMGYQNSWNSADQIPARAVANGDITGLSTIDPSSGGESERYSLSMQKRWHNTPNSLWLTSFYLIDYQLDLWSNFSYFTQPSGDQIYQLDDRTLTGGDITNTRGGQLLGKKTSYTFGAQWRVDAIDNVGLYHSQQRQKTDVVRLDDVSQQSAALFWQGALQWSARTTSVLNMRWNYHVFSVTPLAANIEESLAVNAGDKTADLMTGSFRTRYALNDNSDLYFNVGRSYHSNDARGVLTQIDPETGDSVSPADPLVPVGGIEVGANWQSADKKWSSSTALWALQIDDELLFVGDAGTTESSGFKSQREGVEFTLNYLPLSDLNLSWDYSYTRSNYRDSDLADTSIEGALKNVVGFAVVKSWQNVWQASVHWRYLGDYHLGDGQYADASQKLDLNLRFYSGQGFIYSLDILNALDSDDKDIEYWYESQLANENAPVADRHFHQYVPRALRLKMAYEY
ncbi:MAG: TonB-dependent receptor plug domain-containing protein [Marinagarivorans sp.]|nr:TonB-dependent receptor plug domain-containing protein [Marinagarivorans sp.]